MTSNRTQLIARLSILCALTVVLGYYTKLPTPTGIVTLLDLGVYFTAFYFGRKEGAIVGGVGAFLLDPVSYTHLRAHETRHDLVCRLLLEKKKRRK